MKVFIVGKYNTFTNALIQKLHKENDKVYVLTGENYHGDKPHAVFEQYAFPYSSDSIVEILDSVQPDVILFTGAYDTNFQWRNIRNESMHYLSGLINIILSAASILYIFLPIRRLMQMQTSRFSRMIKRQQITIRESLLCRVKSSAAILTKQRS